MIEKLNIWDTEPDIVLFTEPETGYKCFIRRVLHRDSEMLGFLCGYVILPEDHPYYDAGKDLYDLGHIDVHWGVSFVNFLHIELEGVIPYAIGFDCCHAGDLIFEDVGGEYRDIAYVKNECINLAKQLKEIEGKHEQRTNKTD